MQSGISITSYDAICNLGNNIDEIFENALKGSNEFLSPLEDIVKDKKFYFGKVNCDLPQIKDERFNLRVNRLLLHLLNDMEENLEQLFKKYPKSRIGTVIATTNSGIEEYEKDFPYTIACANFMSELKNKNIIVDFYKTFDVSIRDMIYRETSNYLAR